jgi:inorganic triphosphatase YgiF
MTAQELQLLVSIVAGAITIATVFVGLVVNAWRSGRAHEAQKAVMKAEVQNVTGKLDTGFALLNNRVDHLQALTRQSLEEGARRMQRHSATLSELKAKTDDNAEELAELRGQLGG